MATTPDAPDEVARLRRRLELLAAAGDMFARSLEPQATLNAIAALLVPAISDWCRVDLIDAQGVMQRALTYHSDPEKTRQGTELAERLRAAPGAVGSMAWVAETGQPHLAHFDPPLAFDRLRDKDLLSFAQAIGMRAYFTVPLIARGRTLGALAAVQAESGRDITQDDCALISEIAQRAALALDNARLFAEMQAANRAKDEFLAMLGHELRNPLAPIVTALSLMERRGTDVDSMERRIIGRQVSHLSRLVDDLLDVSRITKGKIQLEREHVDLKMVVARALELTQPALEQRAEPLRVRLPDAPVTVHGDPVRLVQVLCNLLTNAAKFTPSDGSIELRVRAPVAPQNLVEITVTDAGVGIAPSLLPHVFELFLQGEQSSDRGAGGLGLGLAIVKTLVTMHGGTVSAASEGQGRGSTFTVYLPADGGAAAVPAEAMQPSFTGAGAGRVLVVDDNRDAAESLTMLLDAVGYEVRAAENGQSALASLDNFVPDLAILDIGLPGMDGYELAHRLRADARAPGLRLVALTGYGREHDRARALAAHFHEHLVKPVEAARLFATVERLLRKE